MLKAIFFYVVGLVGAFLVAYGAWLYMPALGFAVGGLLLMFMSAMSARAEAVKEFMEQRDNQKGAS